MKKTNLRQLLENGLIFEINRQILHPLGFSLTYKPSTSSDDPDGLVLLQTDDREGCLYPESNFMDGASKFSIYMKNIGEKKLAARMKILGYLRQTRSDQ
jgi:hypothetical protein